MVQEQQMATIYKSKHIHPHSNRTHTTQHDYINQWHNSHWNMFV